MSLMLVSVPCDVDSAVAALVKLGFTVTPPVIASSPPVVVPPPVPVVGTGVIYADGKMLWPGDWSGNNMAVDYANKTLVPGKTVAAMTPKNPWAYWLPYILHMPTAGFTNLIVKIKPAMAGQKFSVAAYTSTGVATDIVTGGVNPLPASMASALDADGVVTYTVPLTALKAVNIDLYKIMVQDQSGLTNDTWGVTYAAFV